VSHNQAVSEETMDPLQEQFEKENGDMLIDWINEKHNTNYVFSRRAGEAPDLVYSYENEELFLEITAAYYDGSHAKFLWTGARDTDANIEPWFGINPTASLKEEIENRILKKSNIQYGDNCLLLVVIPPSLTSAEELESLLDAKKLSTNSSFVGIYVAGRFPTTSSSSGGYQLIPVKKFR
jgi:hypothetical protein